MTAAMMGAVGGQMPLSLLVQQAGWRMALEIVGMLGILLGIVYFLIVRDKPLQVDNSHKLSHPSIVHSLIYILKNPQAWLLSFYSGLAFAPVSVFGGLWGVPFLETAHALSATQAALAASAIFIGFAMTFTLLSGKETKLFQNRKNIIH